MNKPDPAAASIFNLPADTFQALFDALHVKGYTVIGPLVRDAAVVYDEIGSANELPVGYTDAQAPASYALRRTGSDLFFGYTVSPTGWKRYLYPPSSRLWSIHRSENGVSLRTDDESAPKLALLGMRACEIQSLKLLDRVFAEGEFKDRSYIRRRQSAMVIAVNCTQAGQNCFCPSMQAGPGVTGGYDIALTEILDPPAHYFLVKPDSPKGKEIVEALNLEPASDDADQVIEETVNRTEVSIRKSVDVENIRELLYRNYEHPRWDDVAGRCLTCGNCTMVCPTCFCATVEDTTDLAGMQAERTRLWDSCYNLDFSYIHGGSVRPSEYARYRHWLLHKFGTWNDQYGSSGCVGCGRCITWCPAGIDVTEELRSIRQQDKHERETYHGKP